MKTIQLALLSFVIFSAASYAQTNYWIGNGSNIYYSAGKVGIGTNNPGSNLHVYGADNPNFVLQNTSTQLQIAIPTCSGCFASFAQPGDIIFRTLGTTRGMIFMMSNYNNNNGTSFIKFGDETGGAWVGIFNNKIMRIDGKLIAKEISIQANVWSDRVFRNDYPLRPIPELKDFISTHNHLPDIPSETEVKANGVNIADMQAKLLQKIEELTLYVIQQDQTIRELQNEIRDLKSK